MASSPFLDLQPHLLNFEKVYNIKADDIMCDEVLIPTLYIILVMIVYGLPEEYIFKPVLMVMVFAPAIILIILHILCCMGFCRNNAL